MMRDLDVSDPVYPSFAILPETAVWTDYDGVWASSDHTIDAFGHAVPGTDYETGFAEVDPVGQVSYMHTDQIGTLRGVTDDTATPTMRPVYTAFGEPVYEDGTVGTRYRYAGEWGYESFANLDWGTHDWGGPNGVDTLEFPYLHVGHRYYNPATGRFLQRDAIGTKGGLNVYAYVAGNPVLRVDPSGLLWGDTVENWVANNIWRNIHSDDVLANMSDSRAIAEAVGISVGVGVAGAGAYVAGSVAISGSGGWVGLEVGSLSGLPHVVAVGSAGGIQFVGEIGRRMNGINAWSG